MNNNLSVQSQLFQKKLDFFCQIFELSFLLRLIYQEIFLHRYKDLLFLMTWQQFHYFYQEFFRVFLLFYLVIMKKNVKQVECFCVSKNIYEYNIIYLSEEEGTLRLFKTDLAPLGYSTILLCPFSKSPTLSELTTGRFEGG